jgi:hypothetical protein
MSTANEIYGSGVTPKIGDTERMLLVKLVTIGVGGGGGGGGGVSGGGVTAGDYGGGVPSFTPTSSGAITFDTSNGRVWNWYSGQWN